MHDLPYWDPVLHVTLGFMHNFLEGVLQHQLRELWKENEGEKGAIDEDEQYTDDDVSETASELSDLEQEAREHTAQPHTGLSQDINDIEMDNDHNEERTPTPSAYHQADNEVDEEEEGDADYDHNAPDLFNFMAEELERIQLCIQHIILPTWVACPPGNLGEAGHGKLKAHEYLVLFAVILPLILPELWWNKGADERCLFDSFYHLIACTNIIASFSTSNAEADIYMDAYVKYCCSIQQLYPCIPSRPNHHYATHNGKLLKFLGPLAALSEQHVPEGQD